MPGTNADRVLGPGPDPGGRIVLEAAQLSAIARQYNVAWRSVSRADRRGAGMARPPDAEGGGDRGRPRRHHRRTAPPTTSISTCRASTRRSSRPKLPPSVTVVAARLRQQHRPLHGRADGHRRGHEPDRHPGQRPRRRNRGSTRCRDPAAAGDSAAARRRPHRPCAHGTSLQNEVARSLDQIVGMQLRRPVAAGQPLRLADLSRPPLVQRGATVQIELSLRGPFRHRPGRRARCRRRGRQSPRAEPDVARLLVCRR